MMSNPRRLTPPEPAFRTRDALALGMTGHALRDRTLDRSFWGLRRVTPARDLAERCALLALRMPSNAFFTQATAALMHRMPLPLRLEQDPLLHVGVPAPHRAPHARGVVGHQLTTAPAEVTLMRGIRLTSVERTWCDLATRLSLHDLVAAGDFLVHWRHPLTTIERLRNAVDRRTSRRGIRVLRRALELLDIRSESPPESVLRVILVEGGAPAIRVNHVVTDKFGEFVARTDLIIDEWKLVLEYQGDYHRTAKGQWRADMTRRSRLEAGDVRVMELNADDLRDPEELMRRIRRRVRLAP